MTRLVTCLAFLAACGAPAPEKAAPSTKPLAVAVPAYDARDQYALAEAIATARRADREIDPGALDRTRADFEGARYHWEARFVPALCARPDACMVAPFDHARSPSPMVHGFLPRLVLDAATHRDLVRRCEPMHACVITFDGTLDRFVSSEDLPTSLRFADVTVSAVREARADESWLRQPRS